MKIGSVKTDRFEMKYMTFGNGETPFVIIPGVAMFPTVLSADAVKNEYKRFGEMYTVYLFDRKDNMERGYSVDDMAEDTSAAMKELGIRDAFIMGTSQGGMIAQCIAANHPELVARLALISTISRQNSVSTETFRRWKMLCESNDVAALNKDIYSKVYSKPFYKAFEKQIAETEHLIGGKEMQRFHILADACFRYNTIDMLDRIKCPTLVVGSWEDNVLGWEGSVEIAEKLKCSLIMVNRYGHALYDESPDFKKQLWDFFLRM